MAPQTAAPEPATTIGSSAPYRTTVHNIETRNGSHGPDGRFGGFRPAWAMWVLHG